MGKISFFQSDFQKIAPDLKLSIKKNGIKIYGKTLNHRTVEWREFEFLLKTYDIDINKPLKEMTNQEIEIIKYGSKQKLDYIIYSESKKEYYYNRFIEGVMDRVNRMFYNSKSQIVKNYFAQFMSFKDCKLCDGSGFTYSARNTFLKSYTIMELKALSFEELLCFFNQQFNEDLLLNICKIRKRLQTLIIWNLGHKSFNDFKEIFKNKSKLDNKIIE